MAILLYPDGRECEVVPENGRYFTLAEKRRLVPGARHELIFLDDRRAMLAAEDAPGGFNAAATEILDGFALSERSLSGTVLLFNLDEFRCDAPPTIDDLALARHTLERVRSAERPMRVEEPAADGLW